MHLRVRFFKELIIAFNIWKKHRDICNKNIPVQDRFLHYPNRFIKSWAKFMYDFKIKKTLNVNLK